MPEVHTAYDMYLVAERLIQSDKQSHQKSGYEILSFTAGNILEARVKLGEVQEFVFNNLEKAAANYKAAAENNLPEAQYRYANMLMTGMGVTVNPEEAFIWYKKAAKNGISEAQFVLGEYYRNGRIVNKNLKKAKKWYKLALENGYEPAEMRLNQLKKI